ncbi:uncharacterized protein si:zfos-911d5.4 [Pygocentrus nattereri]|uniref:uncharacterized protein si:zfos-911d5.4 n=1 Tax=Pygocentrus nattereri TaxID=42514 RepID=UPI0008142A48|nr:uncharacterized protein si:zfos-911d5.4 [Pygocentrus nattereri]XP_037400234.1 uncharacterized protein si:zfos-911d5.4 [Pygocentrus nattereri]XP_037400235.1 uncharacterized protein si:zfos-911d5.4 [Pygocentrus nattereri]XP_037400236.1 uncharacterized protein si:zfos-911d5.4 [Pygocentrus nattereri]XP_037400237.1 uncharacterized protein si:zfos-911d5.4 [Pygocentrus nattereri]XP_037400238.1 uncharacterized protein si:zfos-911d5.4 [Pygocentrus nattereri]
MFQLGSRLGHMYLSSGPGGSSSSRNNTDPGGSDGSAGSGSSGLPSSGTQNRPEKIPSLPELIQHFRRVSGLKKEDVFCNLRVPNRFQTAREEINLVIITGSGVYCIDVKPWTGVVSAQGANTWHVQMKEEGPNFTNTSIQQVPDPLQAVVRKASDLCSHVRQCGVHVRQSLFLPRVLFLSPRCILNDGLRKRKELVSCGDLETFLCSLREGYMAWITDALTPSWISGHLSFRQLGAVRDVLGQMGTWDLVQLSSGAELKGDYQGCQHLALNRQDTDVVEFSRGRTLSSDTLWALLGHTPQVTVRMYKRGAQSWLGKPLTGTATIPSNTHVVFRISGEDKDAKIPANTIHTITLSI